MALLERVSTLVRANLNDLIDKAEDPEKMIKQVILDMQNQLLQVKTQVAIAIADQHLLEKKRKENEEKVAEWMRKAELAVDKKAGRPRSSRFAASGKLSRTERKLRAAGHGPESAGRKSENCAAAIARQSSTEAEGQGRSADRAATPRPRRQQGQRCENGHGTMIRKLNTFDRMKRKVARTEAVSQAKSEIAAEDIEDRLAVLEKEDRIEQLLAELKNEARSVELT